MAVEAAEAAEAVVEGALAQEEEEQPPVKT